MLKDADALTAACVEWAWARAMLIHNRRGQSEVTALCHLWLCGVAALDKTNDGVEWGRQIGDRFSLDRNRSDSLRSVPIQSQYQDRCVL